MTTRRDENEKKPLAPGLYIVSTPIGNLRDITLRALDVLAAADVIACEDSRVTGKLLSAYGIRTPTTPYHDHNGARARPRLIAQMKAGAAVAQVTDAGTPLVSDPGFKLAQAARAEGLAVTAVPGASAALAALVVAGLPSDAFAFAGFAPARSAQRCAMLARWAAVPGTLVFYESARRLAAFLADAEAVLGPRPAAVARELTKLHEEVATGTLAELAARYAHDGAPRGEVVVVIGGRATGAGETEDTAALDDALRAARAEGASLRDAVDRAAAATGLPRRRVYARALELEGTTT